jgi:ribosomal protein S18 acetylase RimI-like enzyme
MTDDAIQIREFREEDLDAVVAFSLRAWEPVFESLREVLGDKIFLRLHPDWRSNQAEAVKSSCLNEQRDVFVAVADGKPVGFAAVALNAFHEGMGVIEIIGVDPDYQRRGISSRLTEHATEHMQRCGMDIAVVETGGDPATHLRGRHTKLPASRCSRSPGISDCSDDIPARWPRRVTPRDNVSKINFHAPTPLTQASVPPSRHRSGDRGRGEDACIRSPFNSNLSSCRIAVQ